MIPQKYIKQFLHRPLDDHRWLKELSHKEIDWLIAGLRPKPKLWPGLRLHQKVAFYLGVTYGFEAKDTGGGFSFWLDMGSGKTLITLELLKYWRQAYGMNRALVFVLSDKAYPTWERQIKEYEIGLPFVSLEGSSVEKWAAHKMFGDGIIICSYPGAVAMCADKVLVKRKNKPPVKKMKLVRDKVLEFMDGVDVLTMDESTRLGHRDSLSHKLCDFIGDRVVTRYALAGIPFGRDPTMIWAQQKIVDGGVSFGPTLELFRETMFSKEKNVFGKNRFSYIYHFDKSKTRFLSRMMQHRSITYEEHELSDVPKINEIIIPVKLRGEAREYYNRAVDEIKTLAKDGQASYTATKNVFLRMRQITSGFLGFSDDETGEKIKLEFKDNPKLDTLLEKLGELPDGRKAVVFYDYTYSGRRITEELQKLQLGPIWLWSGTKSARQALENFRTKKSRRVIVINNRLGAFSLDGLQEVANYVFFYESPVPVIDRRQAEKRVKRAGQKRRVYQFDLVCSGTVDERILEFHEEGRDLMKTVRKDPGLLLK